MAEPTGLMDVGLVLIVYRYYMKEYSFPLLPRFANSMKRSHCLAELFSWCSKLIYVY